jgi:hypothetical protein
MFLQKPIEEFPWKNKLLGKRHTVCKECYAKRSSDWYQDNKDRQLENVGRNNQNYREIAREYVFQYLLEHPGSSCGESDPRVLEFHHEGNKEAEVSRLMRRGASLDALKVEIANCHRRITADERKWYKGR